jgi:cytochrome c biogenesis protein CcmG/thiol:disulfide interchange protein DsbE
MNWRRSMIGFGISVPVIALLAYGMTRDPSQIDSPLPGRPAPSFDLSFMDTPGSVGLDELKGQVVVLNFWASWCLECRYEHADLSTASALYEDQGVRFYGVLYNDTPENGRRWIEMMGGQSYPALIDPGSRTAIDYGLYGVPETFIIDQDGQVVHKQIGVISLAKLSEVIDPLLAVEAAPVTAPIER